LLFGDPEIEAVPLDPDRPWTWPAVVEVKVDLETDDMEQLVGAVWRAKGWCCYQTDEGPW
jgi:hypothetical protein